MTIGGAHVRCFAVTMFRLDHTQFFRTVRICQSELVHIYLQYIRTCNTYNMHTYSDPFTVIRLPFTELSFSITVVRVPFRTRFFRVVDVVAPALSFFLPIPLYCCCLLSYCDILFVVASSCRLISIAGS